MHGLASRPPRPTDRLVKWVDRLCPLSCFNFIQFSSSYAAGFFLKSDLRSEECFFYDKEEFCLMIFLCHLFVGTTFTSSFCINLFRGLKKFEIKTNNFIKRWQNKLFNESKNIWTIFNILSSWHNHFNWTIYNVTFLLYLIKKYIPVAYSK